MSNQEIIRNFYQSFANRDAKGMVENYHNQIIFEDPAFGKLEGERAKSMWKMLISRGKENLKIEFDNISADEKKGSATWIATYPYGPKKRKIINKISASFEFKDGKIIKHTDDFDLWSWSKQALGFSGFLLGWSGFMKSKIQKITNGLLDKFIKS